jgi:hypothetical protein
VQQRCSWGPDFFKPNTRCSKHKTSGSNINIASSHHEGPAPKRLEYDADNFAREDSYHLALRNCKDDLHIDQELMEGSGKWLAQANS